jgi:DNA-binding CsgD family transcriptional regulator
MAPVALTLDYPIVESFSTGQIITLSNAEINETYLATLPRESRWRPLFERFPDGSLACAPVTNNGRPVGAVGVVCATTPAWHAPEFALLEAISAALGLWLTHPDSGLPTPGASESVDDSLSPRQVAILAMVGAGRTNSAIAAALGVSISTVKQDLARAMARLDAADRTEAAETAENLGLLKEVRP